MQPAAPISTRQSAIRVLVVDDSAVVRQLLARELGRDRAIEVVGVAADPFIARDKILCLRPDVLTLDVEMPRMDGITFLRKLMQHHPLPVVVLSSLTAAGTHTAVAALQAGAVEVLCKPGGSYSVDNLAPQLIGAIKSAARAHVRATRGEAAAGGSGIAAPAALSTTDKIIALGASTGGVQALTEVLTAFPPGAPGTVVVQHMPPRFTASFAERLNGLCHVEVREAGEGDAVLPGRVLIAPGGRHLLLRRSGARYFVQVQDGPEVFHQRPSVEVLFNSVARHAGANAVAGILTGMGADGATGLLAVRKAGGRTLAQDAQSSVVYGMPMEAVKCGGAEKIVPLSEITRTLMQWVQAMK